MYVVVVDIALRPNFDQELAQVFKGPFSAAIKAQDGFLDVSLLQPVEGRDYELIIVFTDQQLQQKWVATALHAEVWAAMEANFESYKVRAFHSV
jgi:heme-degrading monooxygenase HmoA